MKYEGMPRPIAKAKEPSLDTGRDKNRINRVKKTYSELQMQPEALENTLKYTDENKDSFISALCKRNIKRVILIGCGDSWFVGTCLEELIEKLLCCPCQSYDAYEFYSSHSHSIDDETVIIGQSASGTTRSVLDSLEKAKEKGAFTIGLSNTAEAKILKMSDYGLLVQAKREGWPTQATTSAIGAIAWLFASLCIAKQFNSTYAEQIISELKLISGKMKLAITANEEVISNKVYMFNKTIYFQSTGCGTLYGVSQIASAKLKELCPVHASSYPLEEFHHYRSLKPGDPLILFVKGGVSTEKEIDTALVGAYDGGKIIVVGSHIPQEMLSVTDLVCIVPETFPELQALVSSTIAHLFAYYVAMSKYEADIGYPSEV